MNSNLKKGRSRQSRFGGELPLGCDLSLARPEPLPDNVCCFSHGRSALVWLLKARGPFRSAAVCAYTCPTVPRIFASLGLKLGFFDHDDPDPAGVVEALPGRCLVLLPAPFGMGPWCSATGLAWALGDKAMVVIDAAQTAFGHLDYVPPPGGAVLSGPRKAVAVGDGAVLRLEHVSASERRSVAALSPLPRISAMRQRARSILAEADEEQEREALALLRKAERAWPDAAHRMSDESMKSLLRIDRQSHAETRRRNARRLDRRLAGSLESPLALRRKGTPFHYPVLVDGRDRMLKRLHARRVFATPLWPDAVHDPAHHPRAAEFARRLLALPVDQRYDVLDMDELAGRVLSCL